MDGGFRQPAKLQKRKSRERQEFEQMSGGLSGQPAVNSSQPTSAVSASENMTSAEKEKRSKWRMSNPFSSKEKASKDGINHSQNEDAKEKEKEKARRDADSAYFSSERSSADPSLSNQARPVSGEQYVHPPTNHHVPPLPTTHTPSPNGHTQESLALPQQSLQSRSSHENVGREMYRDAGTGNIVTPNDRGNGSAQSIHTSGPSPPQPAPPQPDNHYHQGPGLSAQSAIPHNVTPPIPSSSHQQSGLVIPQDTHNDATSSPPIPAKNNIRHRVELDSVSPGVQRPNPMEESVTPVSPGSPTRANFSYPARAPPQGVPRQVPANGMPLQQYYPDQQHQHSDVPPVPPVPGQQQQQPRRSSIPQLPAYQQQQSGMPPLPRQQHPGHPSSLQPGNTNGTYNSGHDLQKQGTMANLKAAAAGIHGAGETLRGTFNDTFDRRNPNAHAKNQAVIDKGRSEIEAARARQYANTQQAANQPPTIPQHTQGSTAGLPQGSSGSPGKTAYQGPPVSGSQIEGKSGGGKLSNIMKKMKEGPAAGKEGAVR
ncbi:hypothetical protein PtrCC142_004063 [Pyrenophora tritici-repentis]|uniref:DUF1421 multi-domain protein n=1 Tax=Pyrenophora tritici-repentis TaxID=45151 RepID=A0A834VQF8_9PLEO|nr:DUF1421 multi-domain protein [Pyrenophora tritici-repentis]KAI1542885.1 hypothetical protein PtrSN001C_004052 [Pyrenophora tritici-repentis]KAI1581641.1 hypothetical protein PtrEW7m1_004344 [Pyrenophora tritici-repentis]KAI1603764.1 hypothetical protein PtrCC142_004063 [Pyrenophora tritici-repentis]